MVNKITGVVEIMGDAKVNGHPEPPQPFDAAVPPVETLDLVMDPEATLALKTPFNGLTP